MTKTKNFGNLMDGISLCGGASNVDDFMKVFDLIVSHGEIYDCVFSANIFQFMDRGYIFQPDGASYSPNPNSHFPTESTTIFSKNIRPAHFWPSRPSNSKVTIIVRNLMMKQIKTKSQKRTNNLAIRVFSA